MRWVEGWDGVWEAGGPLVSTSAWVLALCLPVGSCLYLGGACPGPAAPPSRDRARLLSTRHRAPCAQDLDAELSKMRSEGMMPRWMMSIAVWTRRVSSETLAINQVRTAPLPPCPLAG